VGIRLLLSGTEPTSQHVVPHEVSVLSLEGQEAEQPEEELQAVEDHKEQQQFFCLEVSEAMVLAVLHISRYCQDLVDQHQHHSRNPGDSDGSLHGTSDSREASDGVDDNGGQGYQERQYSDEDHHGAICRVPAEAEEHEDPHYVSWRVSVALDPEEGAEEDHGRNDQNDQDLHDDEVVCDQVAGADIRLSEPNEGDHEGHSHCQDAKTQEDEEEGFSEALPAAEAHEGYEADEEEDD
jgi:hypothetical protein